MTDSTDFDWHPRPGAILAARYLRTHALPVVPTPLSHLPRLSKRVIGFALRLVPGFLDRADVSFPIIVAGRGWYQMALDGRHRISKAIWTDRRELPAVRIPFAFALELLLPGLYEAEWLGLFIRRRLRKSASSHLPSPV